MVGVPIDRPARGGAGSCGGKKRSDCGLCVTAAMCKSAWAIGLASGFSERSVGREAMAFPTFAWASFGPRKSR